MGTTDAEQAKRFYGDLFGWRYTLDPNSEGKYHLVSYPGADTPSGAIFDTGGEFPDPAIFMVVVQDVAAVCAQVERLGGKVLRARRSAPNRAAGLLASSWRPPFPRRHEWNSRRFLASPHGGPYIDDRRSRAVRERPAGNGAACAGWTRETADDTIQQRWS